MYEDLYKMFARCIGLWEGIEGQDVSQCAQEMFGELSLEKLGGVVKYVEDLLPFPNPEYKSPEEHKAVRMRRVQQMYIELFKDIFVRHQINPTKTYSLHRLTMWWAYTGVPKTEMLTDEMTELLQSPRYNF